MFNVAVYNDGIVETVGVPSYFLEDDDLSFVLNNVDARRAFTAVFGDGVCVGRIGESTDDLCFVENENYEITLPQEADRKGDLSFYAKL